jgi:macrolide transport system ATP-binding/permease protein
MYNASKIFKLPFILHFRYKMSIVITSIGMTLGTFLFLMILGLNRGSSKFINNRFANHQLNNIDITLKANASYEYNNLKNFILKYSDEIKFIKLEKYFFGIIKKEGFNEYAKIELVHPSFIEMISPKFLLGFNFDKRTSLDEIILGENIFFSLKKNGLIHSKFITICFDDLQCLPFKLRGVLKYINKYSSDLNDTIFIPENNLFFFNHYFKIQRMTIFVKDYDRTIWMADFIKRLLPKKISSNSTFYFNTKLINDVVKIKERVNIVIIFITILTLALAGLGILNTLWLSLYARREEIALRKTFGGSNYIILLQFLIEGVLLAAVGTILGLIITIIVYIGITKSPYPDLIILNPIDFLFLGSTPVVIGCIFGFIPAIKAVKINPREILYD